MFKNIFASVIFTFKYNSNRGGNVARKRPGMSHTPAKSEEMEDGDVDGGGRSAGCRLRHGALRVVRSFDFQVNDGHVLLSLPHNSSFNVQWASLKTKETLYRTTCVCIVQRRGQVSDV